LNSGDKVQVPRTGGGYSNGIIIAIDDDRAIVEFPLGNTYRGMPSNPEDREETATKNVALDKLIPGWKKEQVTNGPIKIIIEGWEEEPVVLDNIDQFVLLAQDTEGNLSDVKDCDKVFLGYAISCLLDTFRGGEKEDAQID